MIYCRVKIKKPSALTFLPAPRIISRLEIPAYSMEETMGEEDKRLDLSFTRTTKDIAVAGLAGAVIAALLILGVYFSFKGDFQDQGRKVVEVDNRLTKDMLQLKQRVQALEDLPEQLKLQLVRQGLDDMSRTASFLNTQIVDPMQKKKLIQIGQILRELDQANPALDPGRDGE